MLTYLLGSPAARPGASLALGPGHWSAGATRQRAAARRTARLRSSVGTQRGPCAFCSSDTVFLRVEQIISQMPKLMLKANDLTRTYMNH